MSTANDPEHLAALYQANRASIQAAWGTPAERRTLALLLTEDVLPSLTSPIPASVHHRNDTRQQAYERLVAVGDGDTCSGTLQAAFQIADKQLEARTPNGDVLRWRLQLEAEGGPALVAAWVEVVTDVLDQLPEPEVPSSYWFQDDAGPLRRYVAPHSGLMGYRGPTGEVVVFAQFEWASPFSPDGLASVQLVSDTVPITRSDDFWWIDTTGRLLHRAYYEDFGADAFVGDRARYVEGSQVGFIDRRGNIVVPAQFDWATGFHDGVSVVCHGCAARVQDDHDDCDHFSVRHRGGSWGAISPDGTVIVPITLGSLTAVQQQLTGE